ncbi:MAG: resolvase [Ruminococcaceae bacterium]|nr:resolvase [Oscillospiraceae bacterium]
MATYKITVQRGGSMNDNDRLALASLLIKAGYTVRITREKKEGRAQAVIAVEYREERGL